MGKCLEKKRTKCASQAIVPGCAQEFHVPKIVYHMLFVIIIFPLENLEMRSFFGGDAGYFRLPHLAFAVCNV